MNLDRIIAVRNNKTLYRDKDRCLKVFCEEHTKAGVFSEALNQIRMEEKGFNVPKISEVTSIEGKYVIVSEFIKGKNLYSLMEDDPDKTNEYLNLFTDLQIKINSESCLELSRLKDRLNYRICDSDLPATVRYDLHLRLEEMPNESKICHGDFYPTNIIISEDNVPFILDWSHATVGNASADAARTYILFKIKGKDEYAEKYLELYSQKSGTEISYIKKWIPVVAASLSISAREEERKILYKLI